VAGKNVAGQAMSYDMSMEIEGKFAHIHITSFAFVMRDMSVLLLE